MATDGTEPLPSTPEEYAADIDREETQVVGGGEALGPGGGKRRADARLDRLRLRSRAKA